MKVLRIPEKVSTTTVAAFCAVLIALQLASGTDPVFALLVVVFVSIAAACFNRTGGLTTTLGVGVTMLALKIVVVSQCAKVLFWQPADWFLEAPLTTIAVLSVGIGSIFIGVALAGDVRRYAGLIPALTTARTLLIATLTCWALAAFSAAMMLLQGANAGSGEMNTGGMVGVARQLSICAPISIVMATAYTIVSTGGKRSVSWLVAGTFLVGASFAFVSASKQGLFEGVVYYALTCIAWRFPFRRVHAVTLSIAAVIGLLIVWPVMQAVKSTGISKSVTLEERLELALDVLSKTDSLTGFLETRDEVTDLISDERFQYYGRPVGWLERFSLIEQDDELVLAAEQRGNTGLRTITHAFEALIPSFIHPDKPTRNTAGFLGKQIGSIDDDDDDTQISFGIIAESYLAFGWLGVLLLPGLLVFAFANTTSRLTGTLYRNVWAVYLAGRVQHYFVENTISAFIQDMIVLSAILFAISSAIRVMDSLLSPPPAEATRP